MNVTFHPEAREELLAAVRHYDQAGPDLGAKFLQSVAACIGRIRSFPESYPRVHAEYRRAGVHRFPYGIVFHIGTNSISLVAVMHDKRKPEYYVERLK